MVIRAHLSAKLCMVCTTENKGENRVEYGILPANTLLLLAHRLRMKSRRQLGILIQGVEIFGSFSIQLAE